MTGALLLQVLAAVGGLAGVSAFVNLLISRRKIAAESDDIIQTTTDRVIKNLNDDNGTLRAEIKGAKQEVAELRLTIGQLYDIIGGLEAEGMENRRATIRLINWSRIAFEKMLENNIPIDAPPSMEHLKPTITKKD
jgi:hypothetical protein